MQKFSLLIFVFMFVVSQNKFISYFKLFTGIIKEYANATSLELNII